MTYDETDGAMVTIAQAQRECHAHGANAFVHGKSYAPLLQIYDRGNGDHWGNAAIVDGMVNARDVLHVLGY